MSIHSVDVKFLLAQGAEPPAYMTTGAAGADLFAKVSIVFNPGETRVIPTTVEGIALPPGYEAQVRGRSSMSRSGVLVHVGTIDSDYRGGIGVCMTNLNAHQVGIGQGERVAQLVVSPVVRAHFWRVEPEELDVTVRGKGGWGSTGR